MFGIPLWLILFSGASSYILIRYGRAIGIMLVVALIVSLGSAAVTGDGHAALLLIAFVMVILAVATVCVGGGVFAVIPAVLALILFAQINKGPAEQPNITVARALEAIEYNKTHTDSKMVLYAGRSEFRRSNVRDWTAIYTQSRIIETAPNYFEEIDPQTYTHTSMPQIPQTVAPTVETTKSTFWSTFWQHNLLRLVLTVGGGGVLLLGFWLYTLIKGEPAVTIAAQDEW
jgi:hypothetical protein